MEIMCKLEKVIVIPLYVLTLIPFMCTYGACEYSEKSDAETYLERIWDLKIQGKPREAAEKLKIYIESGNAPFQAHTDLGWIYFFDLGEKQDAKHEFEFVKSKIKEFSVDEVSHSDLYAIALAYTGLGAIYLEEGHFEDAEGMLLASDEIFPTATNYSVLGELALIYRNDYRYCVDFHKNALEMEPESQTEKVNIATCLTLEGQREEAEKLVKSVDNEDDRNAFSLSAYYSVMGDISKSLKYLKQGWNSYGYAPLRQKQLLNLIMTQDKEVYAELLDSTEFRNWLDEISGTTSN